MKKPEQPKNEEESLLKEGDALISYILQPTNEIKRMIQYYRNKLELEMLAKADNKIITNIIEDFAENRVKYVRLHPLMKKITTPELKEMLCKNLEIKIKEELNLLYSQEAPFGFRLAIKHYLPEQISGYDDEDDFIDNLRHADYENELPKVKKEFAQINKENEISSIEKSAWQRSINKAHYNEYVKKIGEAPMMQKTIFEEKKSIRSDLRREKELGDSWNPKKDAPIIPENSDKFDELYFLEYHKK